MRLSYPLEYLTSYTPIIGDYLGYTPFPARASFGDKVRRKIRTKAIQIQKDYSNALQEGA